MSSMRVPRGVDVEILKDGERISFSPFSLVWVWGPFFLLLAVLLGSPVVLIVRDPFILGDSWGLIILTLLLLVVSLCAVYLALVWVFNRSTIEIGQGRLVVKQGPFPYARHRNLGMANIRQIYIIRRERRFGFYYRVYALTKDDLHRALLTVENGEIALYLEREIERFLGIEDQVVRGEWRPEPYLWGK